MAVLDAVREALGGGTLSFWMIGGALVAIWLAIKAVKATIKLGLVVAAVFLLVGVAPWSGSPVESAAADCAANAVGEANSGVQAFLTKRITVQELSPDAACDGEDRLATGTATVRLRTYADIPFRTYTVVRGEVEAR